MKSTILAALVALTVFVVGSCLLLSWKYSQMNKRVAGWEARVENDERDLLELIKDRAFTITAQDRKDLINRFTREIFSLHKKIRELQESDETHSVHIQQLQMAVGDLQVRLGKLEDVKKVQIKDDSIKAITIHDGKARVVCTDDEGHRIVLTMSEKEYERLSKGN